MVRGVRVETGTDLGEAEYQNRKAFWYREYSIAILRVQRCSTNGIPMLHKRQAALCPCQAAPDRTKAATISSVP